VNTSRNPTTTSAITSSASTTIGINNKSPPMSPLQSNQNSNASIVATTKRPQESLDRSMTTRLPANSSVTNNDNKNNKTSITSETIKSSPQSIAVIGGRKYIVVPKTNEMCVSPGTTDGDTRLMSSMVGNKRDKNRLKILSGNDNNINLNNIANNSNNIDLMTLDNGGNE